MEDKIIPLNSLDEMDIALLNYGDKREHVPAHYPSSASIVVGGQVYGACLRKQYYRLTKVPASSDMSPSSLYPMMLGNFMHEGLQAVYTKEYEAEKEYAFEAKLNGLSLPMRGRLDIYAEGSSRGKLAVEIKTVYGRAIAEVKENPKPEHILQAICYHSAVALDLVELLYIARDNFNRFVHTVTFGNTGYLVNGRPIVYSMEGIIERWKDLEVHLEHGTVPPQDFHWCGKCDKKKRCKTCDWQCVYCEYKETCYGMSVMEKLSA